MTDITQWIAAAKARCEARQANWVLPNYDADLPRALAALEVAMEGLETIECITGGDALFTAQETARQVAAILEGRDDQA